MPISVPCRPRKIGCSDQPTAAPYPPAAPACFARNRLARSRASSRARSGSASLLRLPRSLSASSPAADRAQQPQQRPSSCRSCRWRRSSSNRAPQMVQVGTVSPARRRALRRACRSAGVVTIGPLSRCWAFVTTSSAAPISGPGPAGGSLHPCSPIRSWLGVVVSLCRLAASDAPPTGKPRRRRRWLGRSAPRPPAVAPTGPGCR